MSVFAKPPKMTPSAFIKIVLPMLLWAACFPPITLGLPYSPYLTFATLRALIAGIALLLVTIAMGSLEEPREQLLSMQASARSLSSGLGLKSAGPIHAEITLSAVLHGSPTCGY